MFLTCKLNTIFQNHICSRTPGGLCICLSSHHCVNIVTSSRSLFKCTQRHESLAFNTQLQTKLTKQRLNVNPFCSGSHLIALITARQAFQQVPWTSTSTMNLQAPWRTRCVLQSSAFLLFSYLKISFWKLPISVFFMIILLIQPLFSWSILYIWFDIELISLTFPVSCSLTTFNATA